VRDPPSHARAAVAAASHQPREWRRGAARRDRLRRRSAWLPGADRGRDRRTRRGERHRARTRPLRSGRPARAGPSLSRCRAAVPALLCRAHHRRARTPRPGAPLGRARRRFSRRAQPAMGRAGPRQRHHNRIPGGAVSKPNMLDFARLQQMVTSPPLHRWLGVSLTALDEAMVEITLPWREELVAHTEIRYTHGGIIATLI